jgi:hypothetical protein
MSADTDRDDMIVFYDDDGNVVLVLPAEDVDAIIPVRQASIDAELGSLKAPAGAFRQRSTLYCEPRSAGT